jgi:selenocysteine-specific elongation factor
MILATAGHIDHGKTALVEALTGVDADRLEEEKRRGMTIDLGFAYSRLEDGTPIGFVDVPGHERFLPNMLAGVLAIDRVLLVVAADDGARPQTLEHLDILDLIGVARVTGVVTKIDRVGPERRAQVVAEVGALLAAAGYEDAPIFAVSSRTGEGIAEFAQYLSSAARSAAQSRASSRARGRFRMAIDRAFSLPGIGLVVTGTVASGAVRVGDRLLVSPAGSAVRVRGLHAQNQPVEEAAEGERCAVAIVGSFAEGRGPGRGDWLLAPERHAPSARIDLSLRVSRFLSAPLRDGLPIHCHLGTADIVGRVGILEGRELAPGERGFVQIDLDRPVSALGGDRTVVRDHGQRRTLGGGRVVDPFPPRRGRRAPARLAALRAMAESEPAPALARLLAEDGLVDLGRFALVRNLAPGEEEALFREFLVVGPGRERYAVAHERLVAVEERLLAALAAAHEAEPDLLGPNRAALLRGLSREAPEAVLEAALLALEKEGRVKREGALWRLAEHRPRPSEADQRLWARVQPLLAEAGLRAPRLREIAEALGEEPRSVERFLVRAERFGRVHRVAPNRFFLPETLRELAEIARELAAGSEEGAFTASAFKDRSGVGRNLSIEILETLDRMGVTRRVGEGRILLRDAGEVFG